MLDECVTDRLGLELLLLRHPDAPRFRQRGEGSGAKRQVRPTRDPSLHLKNGFAQDDAIWQN